MIASSNLSVSAVAGTNSNPHINEMKPKAIIVILACVIFATAFALLSQPALHAGESTEHEEEREDEFEVEVSEPTQEESLYFMRKEIPVAIEILELVRETEGDEAYEQVLEDFREQYFEYLEIKAYDGPEAAALVLEGANLDLQVDKALHEYHESENEVERAELRQAMQGLIGKQWQHAIKVSRKELELIEKHRSEVEAELKELEAMDDKALKQWAAKLIEGDEDEEAREDEVEPSGSTR